MEQGHSPADYEYGVKHEPLDLQDAVVIFGLAFDMTPIRDHQLLLRPQRKRVCSPACQKIRSSLERGRGGFSIVVIYPPSLDPGPSTLVGAQGRKKQFRALSANAGLYERAKLLAHRTAGEEFRWTLQCAGRPWERLGSSLRQTSRRLAKAASR